MKSKRLKKQLTQKLTPKQQKLEFAKPTLWSQLPKSVQRDCQLALAKLLCQVIQHHQSDENHDHE